MAIMAAIRGSLFWSVFTLLYINVKFLGYDNYIVVMWKNVIVLRDKVCHDVFNLFSANFQMVQEREKERKCEAYMGVFVLFCTKKAYFS